jgi:hypothetical protein
MNLIQILSILFTLLSLHATPSLCAKQYNYIVRFERHPFCASQLEQYKEVAETLIYHNVLRHSPSYPHPCLPFHIQAKLTPHPKGWLHH